jgi:transposase
MGGLIKVIWHDGQGACLFTKKLERGRFIWPSAADGTVVITPAQLGYLLEGIDWRMPQKSLASALGGMSKTAGMAGLNMFHRAMTDAADQLPGDLASAHAMILAERAARREAQALAARAQAVNSHSDALIARLRLEIEKLKREIHGRRSERKARLLEQMELQLEELEADASQDELAAEMAARSSTVRAFERKRPSRKPFPEHLPRERVVVAAPANCPCCGSAKLAKLGEDITETLEAILRQWKVVQTVHEKFSCRECEKITQPPTPFHVTPRGFAGPNRLAMILFEKFAQHQPLTRQSERYAREGIDLSLSTLADQVGACAAVLTGRIRTGACVKR